MRGVVKSWVLAARPKTLPAAIAPVWAGCVLAWGLTGEWSPVLAVCTLFSACAIQVATNFFNDAVDYRKGADTGARLGPARVTASGMLSEKAVLMIGGVFLLVACGFAVPLILARGWPMIAIGLPSLYFSFGYTGGPLPLAYRGLGEIFVMIFFGLVAVTGTTFVQTGAWHLEAVVLGSQLGALSTVLIAINNLRDVEEDSSTNKKTLAVRFGVTFCRVEITLLFALVVLLSAYWWMRGMVWATAASLLFAIPGAAISAAVWRHGPGRVYNKFLAMSGMTLLFFALFFHVAVMRDRARGGESCVENGQSVTGDVLP